MYIMENYIGTKGYTIHKSNFTQTQLQEFRNILTVKPNSGINGFASTVQYPIYRESTNKMYFPRYFGLDNLGVCKKNVLSKSSKS